MLKKIVNKLKESVLSVLPIYALVIVLNFTPWVDLTLYEIGMFSISTVILIIGISLFNLGADIAMTPMGKTTGSGLTKMGRIGILLIVCFVLGFLITIAEPDLSVLAIQTKAVFNSTVLITCIGLGVATFLVLAILRIIFKVNLSHLLMFCYMIMFAITLLAMMTGNESIIGLAYDSGGVTTGPITVPFLMALGLGVSSIISNKSDKDAGFGLIALCSCGPIIITLLLSIFSSGSITYELGDYALSSHFVSSFFTYLGEKTLDVLLAIGLIVIGFIILDILFLKLPKRRLKQMGIGILYTLAGLILFLTAADACYISIGYKIGSQIASQNSTLLVIIGFVIGSVTVLAEPAIHVLNTQVEEITGGLVKKKEMLIALTIGVGLAICLSMLRIAVQFSILYYLIPGYIICLGLSFFVPKIYTAIAFDSGGVASGPLTTSFILPLGIGACYMLNGVSSILTDAFGIVAMVAMSPIITIELLGIRAIIKDRIKSKLAVKKALKQSDEVIIDFMEEEVCGKNKKI